MMAVDVLAAMPIQVKALTAAGDGPWSVAIYIGAETTAKGAERLTCWVSDADGARPAAEVAALIWARVNGRCGGTE